jgi:hypothetical protein
MTACVAGEPPYCAATAGWGSCARSPEAPEDCLGQRKDRSKYINFNYLPALPQFVF